MRHPHPEMLHILFIGIVSTAIFILSANNLSSRSLEQVNSYRRDFMGSRDAKTVDFAPMRTQLKPGEFILEKMTEQQADEFFSLDLQSLEAPHLHQLEPLWSCTGSNIERRTKFVFLHMSRSAGGLIRAFFRGYSHFCSASYAMVTDCMDLGIEYMDASELWANGKSNQREGINCFLSSASNKTGTSLVKSPMFQMSTQFLQTNQIEILGGHIPIGSSHLWTDSNDKVFPVQHVIFFRHPVDRYVSQLIFEHQSLNLTVSQAVNLVKVTVLKERNMGRYYEKLTNQLITPSQKYWAAIEGITWTMQRRLNLALSNLASSKVMYGLVERLPQSLELLKFMMDEHNEQETLFSFFSNKTKIDKVLWPTAQESITDKVVRQMTEMPNLMDNIKEYLKYELQIYSHAAALHHRQYDWFKSKT